MNLPGILALCGAAAMAAGLVTVFAAVVADRSRGDGRLVFVLVWAGSLTCSLGTLALVAALGLTAADALLP